MKIMAGVCCEPFGTIKKRWWLFVEMELVDIAPHLAMVATFGLHEVYGKFSVRNIETGMHVCHCKTRSQAMHDARNLLSEKTEADLIRVYARCPRMCK